MKSILIMLILCLPACVSLQFDSLEYDRYITIKEIADTSIQSCNEPTINDRVKELKLLMDHQYLYSFNREARPQVAEAATNLKDIVDKLYNRYKQGQPSVAYCQEKLNNVSLGATTVVRVLGRL